MSRTAPSPSRRALVSGAVSGVAAGAVLAGAGPARAGTAYTPARYRGHRLLGAAARHLVGRFSYGVTPALAAQVRAPGGARGGGAAQRDPPAGPPPRPGGLRAWGPRQGRAPRDHSTLGP